MRKCTSGIQHLVLLGSVDALQHSLPSFFSAPSRSSRNGRNFWQPAFRRASPILGGSEGANVYSPQVSGGCVPDKADHIRLLDKSLETSSGLGIFRRINDMLWQNAEEDSRTGTTPVSNITTTEELDQNERFGILSHGLQDDPIYNFGNHASLLLFEQTLDNLCQTPSRFSTVESLMDDRDRLIRQIKDNDHGTIPDAVRTSTKGNLFVMDTIWVWNVYDDDGRRIGLAALYDRAHVRPYTGSLS